MVVVFEVSIDPRCMIDTVKQRENCFVDAFFPIFCRRPLLSDLTKPNSVTSLDFYTLYRQHRPYYFAEAKDQTKPEAEREIAERVYVAGDHLVPYMKKVLVERDDELDLGLLSCPNQVADFTPELVVHCYQCEKGNPDPLFLDFNTSGEQNDEITLPPLRCWRLPHEFFEGVWESLQFGDDSFVAGATQKSRSDVLGGPQELQRGPPSPPSNKLDALKHELLEALYCAMSLSQKKIDPNLVPQNKVFLFHGPPGTGKTSLCKALAQKLAIRSEKLGFKSAQLIEVDAHSLMSKWFSESGKIVTRLFEAIVNFAGQESQKKTAFFILLDEVESLCISRTKTLGASEPTDGMRAVNAVLTQLDRARRFHNIFVLATSNVKEVLDPAFLDRCDYIKEIPPPSLRACLKIVTNGVQELRQKGVIIDAVKPRRGPNGEEDRTTPKEKQKHVGRKPLPELITSQVLAALRPFFGADVEVQYLLQEVQNESTTIARKTSSKAQEKELDSSEAVTGCASAKGDVAAAIVSHGSGQDKSGMTSEKNTTAAAPTTRTTTTGTSAEELPEAAATGSSSGPIFAGGGLLFQRLSVSAVPAASTPLLPAPTSSSTSSPSTPSSTETETKLSDRWVLSPKQLLFSPRPNHVLENLKDTPAAKTVNNLLSPISTKLKSHVANMLDAQKRKMVDFVVAKTGVDAEELGLLWKEQTRGKKNEGNELLASSSCTSFAMKSSGLVSYQQQKQHLQSESRRLSTSSATTPNVLCATRCKELSARRLTKLLSKAYTEAKPKIAEDRKVEFAVYINSLVKVLHRFYEEKVLNVAEMGGGGGK
ncbi:unnamed protein product [Amoebophrya sp. A120]|nr:unnamed protein product [Amoebophrya sp. A120]|eukprot:GSA120T00020034001.1